MSPGIERLAILPLCTLALALTPTVLPAQEQGRNVKQVEGESYLPGRPLVARLDSTLQATLPRKRFRWLWGEPAGSGPESCPDAVYEAVRRAARRGEEASGERRYAWWLAADRRAAEGCNQWFELNPDTAGWIRERRQALGALGLHYSYNELGAAWMYRRDLLRRTWKEAPGTRWGHLAFARLQDLGWDPMRTCSSGKKQFELVIEKGERFLTQRKPTPFLRAVVETTLARAYETMWSISQTTSRDMGIFDYPFGPGTPPERKERAAAAARNLVKGDGEAERKRAIERYDSVAGNPAASEELRAYARAKAERLEAGKNTHQYAYYCVYD